MPFPRKCLLSRLAEGRYFDNSGFTIGSDESDVLATKEVALMSSMGYDATYGEMTRFGVDAMLNEVERLRQRGVAEREAWFEEEVLGWHESVLDNERDQQRIVGALRRLSVVVVTRRASQACALNRGVGLINPLFQGRFSYCLV